MIKIKPINVATVINNLHENKIWINIKRNILTNIFTNVGLKDVIKNIKCKIQDENMS